MASIRKRTWVTDGSRKKTAYIVDYVDNRGVRHRPQFTKWKEADLFRIEVENELGRGTYRSDARTISISDACNAFISHCDGRYQRNEGMTRKTLVVYRGHIKNYIGHEQWGIGSMLLAQVSPKAIGEFRDRIRSAGTSVPTTRKVLTTLHAVLAYAISQDWVAVNAASGVRVIGTRDEGSRKISVPSKDAVSAILAIADPDLHLKLLFSLATGVRAGEQWAIRWGDIDMIEGILGVRRRVDAYKEEGPPKSAAGVRDIPVSKALVSELRKLRMASEFSSDKDLVFTNRYGRHVAHDNFIKRSFLPAFANAGLVPFKWHALRHYAVSSWIEAGLPPKTIQTFAGHSSLQITMDRYGHLFPTDDHRRVMDQIASSFEI